MRKYVIVICSLFFGVCLAAQADPLTFDVTFSSKDFTGTAILSGVTDPYSPGAYDMTSGSVTINGFAASLVPGGNTGNTVFLTTPGTTLYYDNAIYTNATPLDGSGLLFLLGNEYINIFYDSATSGFSIIYSDSLSTNNGKESAQLCADIASTPEPSSFALLATGLLAGFAGLRFRRQTA